MPKHIWNLTLDNGEQVVRWNVVKENTGELNIDIPFVTAATNELVAMEMDISEFVSLEFIADKAATIKINSSGSPVQTIELGANVPLAWHEDMPSANPIGQDVTAAYVTCGANTRLRLFGIYKATATP